MTPEEALEFICGEAKRLGADEYDALAGESQSTGLELFEGKVKNTDIASSRGIGIRVFKDRKPGYAFTAKLSKEALTQSAQDAMSHAKISDELPLDLPEPAELPRIDLKMWNEDLESVSLDQLKEFGLTMEAVALTGDPQVENIPYLGAERSSGSVILQNSKGVRYRTRGNSISAGLGVVAARNGSKKMGYYANGGRAFSTLDPKKMAEEAVQRAVELLGAEPLPGGEYPVVISNILTPQIFSMFSSPFHAESVQKGQSRLAGKLDQRIAAPGLDILCDPHVVGGPGSRLFDGEGVVCRPMEIVRDGVLRTFIYNLESAKIDNRLSTGHAARGFAGKAGTGFSNFLVALGNQTLDQLLSAYPKCLYVTRLEGGSGCSAVSGEISIGAQGFWVEGGKRVRPVDRVTLSTNFFDLLMNIRGMSNEYSDRFSSVKVPDVLVEKMFVAG